MTSVFGRRHFNDSGSKIFLEEEIFAEKRLCVTR
jgi:hypothetical protein